MSVRRLLSCQISDSNLLDSGQVALRLPAAAMAAASPSTDAGGASASPDGEESYSHFFAHIHSRFPAVGHPVGGPLPPSALSFPEAKSLKGLMVQFIAKTIRYFLPESSTSAGGYPTKPRPKSPLGVIVDHLALEVLENVIKNRELSPEAMSVLAPSLRKIDLAEPKITGKVFGKEYSATEALPPHWWELMLRAVVRHTNLTKLSLAKNSQISNRHIQTFCENGSFPYLQFMNLRDCRKLTGDALVAITQLKSLTFLDMSGTRITTDDVPLFEDLPRLKHLNIEKCKSIGKKGTMYLYSLGKFSTFHYRDCNNVVGLALLGTHQAGKSTAFKHFRLLLGHHTPERDFKAEELEGYKEVIMSNCIQEMMRLVGLVKTTAGASVQFEWPQETSEAMTRIESMKEYWVAAQGLDSINQISQVWREHVVRRIFDEHRSAFLDSTEWFFCSLARIGRPDYVPTIEDMLRSRVKTIGIVEDAFEVGGLTLRVYDTGSERNERKKWSYTFDASLTMIVYVASLSEYDQLCYEDDTTNRMRESICVFKEIQESLLLRRADLCLVLNKEDVLRGKLCRVPLSDHFEEFNEGDDFDAACKFIKRLYLSSEQYENELAVSRLHESAQHPETDSTVDSSTGTHSTVGDIQEDDEENPAPSRRIGSFPLISLVQKYEDQPTFSDSDSDSDTEKEIEEQRNRREDLYLEQVKELQRSTFLWFQKLLTDNATLREKLSFPASLRSQCRLHAKQQPTTPGRPIYDPSNTGTGTATSSSPPQRHRSFLPPQGPRHRSFDIGSLASGSGSAQHGRTSSPNSNQRAASDPHRSKSFSGNLVNELRSTPRNTMAFVASALNKVHVRKILEHVHAKIAERVLMRDLE